MDFTNCKRVVGKAYNGANGKKIAIEYNGKQYMIKFPPSGKEKPTTLSYVNSCLSEHIGSSIFNMLDIKAQNTILGTFYVSGKEKTVCACRDFTADGSIFYDFCSIKNTIIDSEHDGNGTDLLDLIETIEKQNFVDPKTLLEHFWDLFVVDALIGNFDRHNGNWGFLYQPWSNLSSIAPVFDCGSSLLPQADEKTIKKILESEDEMNARIYHFPTSAIKYAGKKINYYDFMCNNFDKPFSDSLKKITSRVNLKQISDFIYETKHLSELQKEFYSSYISNRYHKILLAALR